MLTRSAEGLGPTTGPDAYVDPVAELDLLELLSADHQKLLEEDPPEVADVAQHLGVERELLYPLIRRHAPEGHTVVAALRADERLLEERMADVEHGTGSPTVRSAALAEALRHHVEAQEPLFSRLRDHLPPEALVRSARSVPLSIGAAPTHAHPLLADGGAVAEIGEDVASVSDHVRDRLHPR